MRILQSSTPKLQHSCLTHPCQLLSFPRGEEEEEEEEKLKKMSWAESRMEASLRQRKDKGTLRRLPAAPTKGRTSSGGTAASRHDNNNVIDFSSNDYLGLGQSIEQAARVEELFAAAQKQQQSSTTTALLGATGSRLLVG